MHINTEVPTLKTQSSTPNRQSTDIYHMQACDKHSSYRLSYRSLVAFPSEATLLVSHNIEGLFVPSNSLDSEPASTGCKGLNDTRLEHCEEVRESEACGARRSREDWQWRHRHLPTSPPLPVHHCSHQHSITLESLHLNLASPLIFTGAQAACNRAFCIFWGVFLSRSCIHF